MNEEGTYALLAAGAYWDVRGEPRNRAPIPPGWKVLREFDTLGSGPSATLFGSAFSARVYQGPGGQIVISYAGTEFGGSGAGGVNDFVSGNIPLAGGNYGMQAVEAALLYERVQAKFGATANINFTGHSLGGGLAGLMAVWFDRPAIVFDPAPFELSARNVSTPIGLVPAFLVVQAGLAANRYLDSKFTSYLPERDFAARESRVISYAVQGEVLDTIPISLMPRIEAADRIPKLVGAAPDLDSNDKHSIDLLAAVLLNGDFEAAAKALPEALPLLFDKNLYGSAPLGAEQNLLVKLVRGEVGVYDEVFGTQVEAPSQLLTKFTDDLEKLVAGSEGMTGQPAVQKALVVAAMEYYYFKDTASATKLFTAENGGIHFKYSDIGASKYKSLPLLAKALQPYLTTSEARLASMQQLIKQDAWHIQSGAQGLVWTSITNDNDASIGGVGVDVMDAGDGNDLLIGGVGRDFLTGGAGNDTLIGGTDFDTYVFAKAASAGWGADVIVDRDGLGGIFVADTAGQDNIRLTGGKNAASLLKSAWVSDDGRYLFRFIPSVAGGTPGITTGKLIITRNGAAPQNESITVQDWSQGQLGVTLGNEPARPVLPAETRVVSGDLVPADTYTMPDGQLRYQQNVATVASPGNHDVLYSGDYRRAPLVQSSNLMSAAMTSADYKRVELHGLGGNDVLWGDAGQDLLDGGAGNDLLVGGQGLNTLIGGEGNDVILTAFTPIGGRPDPRWGPNDDWTAPAGAAAVIAEGANWGVYNDANGEMHISMLNSLYRPGAAEGSPAYHRVNDMDRTWWAAYPNGVDPLDIAQESWVTETDAGAGNDVVIGGLNADIIRLGEGNDVAFGNIGHDDIDGGEGDDRIYGDVGTFSLVDGGDFTGFATGDDILSGGDGADVLVGGLGSDSLNGGDGADLLIGDAANNDAPQSAADIGLFGTVTPATTREIYDYADTIDGGAGDDRLIAGGGDDSLAGGEGNDTLLAEQGNDLLEGGDGNDKLDGGDDSDTLYGGLGDDWLLGGNGSDHLAGQAGTNFLDGGAGDDTLVAGSEPTPGAMALRADGDLLAATLTAPPVNYLVGGEGDDTYVIEEGAGDVVILAPDAQAGPAGKDRLQLGGAGAGWSATVSGADLVLGSSGGSVRVQGYWGTDDEAGDSAAAKALGEGIEFADGTQLSAQELAVIAATGTEAADWLYGTSHADTINGLGGDDRIFGRAGDDILIGGGGDDELTGGTGADTLRGGAGDDSYLFTATTNLLGLPEIDVIDDSEGESRIRITGLDSFEHLQALREADGSTSLYWSGGGVSILGGVTNGEHVQVEVGGQSRTLAELAVEPAAVEPRQDLGPANAQFLAQNETWARADISQAAGRGLYDKYSRFNLALPAWRTVISNEADLLLNVDTPVTYLKPVYNTTTIYKDRQGNIVQPQFTRTIPTTEIYPNAYIFNEANEWVMARTHLEALFRSDGTLSEVRSFRYVDNRTQVEVQAVRTDLVKVEQTTVTYVETEDIAPQSSVVDARLGAGDNTVVFEGGVVSAGAGNDFIQSGLNRADTSPRHIPGYSPEELTDSLFRTFSARNKVLLTGTTAATWMDGGDGNDRLMGGVLSDVLYGGRGFNILDGGAGPDRYLVLDEGAGTGYDYVRDNSVYGPGVFNPSHMVYGGPVYEYVPEGADIDTVEFGPGISQESLRFGITTAAADTQAITQGNAEYLTIDTADGRRLAAIELTAGEAAGAGVEYLQFQGADRVSVAGIVQDVRANPVNHAPVIGTTAVDAATLQGELFSLQLPSSLFTDTDAAEVLTWSVRRDDGDPLPAWLAFDAATRTLSGTPANADAEALGLRISVTDRAGATASQNFTLTVDEVAGAIITGTNDPDNLIGTAGDDTIDGLGRADTLTGGDGDDIYAVDNTRDVVVETPDHGRDRIDTRVSYTLPANVEAIVLVGAASLRATGNELNNDLTGNSGANRLDGAGGADRMAGGAGNDVYMVDDVNDTVVETAGQGTDTVLASISHTLSANVERLTLTGAGVSSGTGNALANLMAANDAGNTLSGLDGNDTLRGGAGADTLLGGEGNDRLEGRGGADRAEGGRGNDTYVIDHSGDTAIEQADEGTDTVQAAVSFTLGANVERLALTGAEALDGTGNALANVLRGNAAANTLSGLDGNDTLRGEAGDDTLLGGDGNDRLEGGAGADRMEGGAGNDTYIVDEAGDQALELAEQGTDTVQAVIGHTLAANIERLTLSGIDAIAGTGNALANILTGNDAANVLRGLAGADTLRGGAGADTLDGGTGNDRLEGGTGADLYLFGRGDGQDTLVENDNADATDDVLRFADGIDADQLWFRKQGDHLDVTIIGTGDRMRINNWYLGEEYHVEKFELANGRHLLDSQVQQMVQAMAAFSPPAAGQTSLPASYHNSLDTVIAANWQ